jgi:hypothetical protein
MELRSLEHPGSWETKDDYLDWLKAHVQHAHNCPAYYLRTERVHEDIEGNNIWRGEVEVFALIGHAQAKRCFAWGHNDERSEPNGKVVVVLELPPIFFVQNAVRTQLAEDLRSVTRLFK